MVGAAGIEPTWSCIQDRCVASTLHPDVSKLGVQELNLAGECIRLARATGTNAQRRALSYFWLAREDLNLDRRIQSPMSCLRARNKIS